ncbi:MAG TPA: hypothetical protein VKB84_19250 [Candidatus Binataceae bacterium]|nr:hypothetical protein [Candidatus Binataceae bacterium]
MAHYRNELARRQRAGVLVNDQAGVFTIAHCTESAREAVENGALSIMQASGLKHEEVCAEPQARR